MLSFVPTPIGNLEDLSLRALRVLSEAEVFFCEDTRHTKRLLHLLADRFQTRFQPDARFISLHSHNEEQRLATLDFALFEQPCVYVSDAGMPGISDPGTALVRFCQQHGIDYTVLPGANAALMAVVDSGLVAKSFVFEGFLPHKSQARQALLKELLNLRRPVVLYEAPTRIEQLSRELAEVAPDVPVAFLKELTKRHEMRLIATGSTIGDRLKTISLKGEWAVVIAPDPDTPPASWLIEALTALQAPKKPLAKILSRLDGQSSAHWYEQLHKGKTA